MGVAGRLSFDFAALRSEPAPDCDPGTNGSYEPSTSLGYAQDEREAGSGERGWVGCEDGWLWAFRDGTYVLISICGANQ